MRKRAHFEDYKKAWENQKRIKPASEMSNREFRRNQLRMGTRRKDIIDKPGHKKKQMKIDSSGIGTAFKWIVILILIWIGFDYLKAFIPLPGEGGGKDKPDPGDVYTGPGSDELSEERKQLLDIEVGNAFEIAKNGNSVQRVIDWKALFSDKGYDEIMYMSWRFGSYLADRTWPAPNFTGRLVDFVREDTNPSTEDIMIYGLSDLKNSLRVKFQMMNLL